MEPVQEAKIEVKINGTKEHLDEIFSPSCIRKKCKEIYQTALNGQTHFKVHLNKLEEVAKLVATTTLQNYPNLNIPFHSHWTHFQAGKINRMLELNEKIETMSLRDKTKSKLALMILSVLLEGPAGLRWRYKEEKKEYSRSEGQAVACFRMFLSGLFSNNLNTPYRVNSNKLLEITLADLEKGFQSSDNNVLAGLEQRLQLLHKLSSILQQNSVFFGAENGRLGNILDYFLEKSSCFGNTLSTTQIFRTMQESFGTLWPGPCEIAGINLGDVWCYKPFGNEYNSFIPFHKLTLWLTYSMLEPLAENGIVITQLHALTGLAEYRNGGLMIDSGLIELKDPNLKEVVHEAHSELVIEWRALTITLLDELAPLVAKELGKSPWELPLAKVLEGGTWLAGRALAQKNREDGGPPLKIQNEGLIF